MSADTRSPSRTSASISRSNRSAGARAGIEHPWVNYLEGKNAAYPATALRAALERDRAGGHGQILRKAGAIHVDADAECQTDELPAIVLDAVGSVDLR